MKINIDMDGVVADFAKFASEQLGVTKHPYEDILSHVEWNKIASQNPRMYAALDKTKDADDLIEYITVYSKLNTNVEVCFLTAVSSKNDVPYAFIDKLAWANKHYPHIPVFFGPFAKNKYQHCKFGDVLIDDRKSNVDEWIAAGGIAHLYRNWEDCKQWLEKNLPHIA